MAVKNEGNPQQMGRSRGQSRTITANVKAGGCARETTDHVSSDESRSHGRREHSLLGRLVVALRLPLLVDPTLQSA